MTEVRGLPVFLCLLLSGCTLRQAEMAIAGESPTRKPSVVLPAVRDTADPGHYALLAYDVGGEAALAAEQLLKKKQLEAAGARLRQAVALAGEALGRVDRDKVSGVWQRSLKFPTARDGTLGADELVAKLTQLRDGAQGTWTETVWPAILATLKKKYQARSAAQLEVLEQLGRPEAQSAGVRGERCWAFRSEDKRLTYCWDRRGQLARRTLADLPDGAPPAPPLPMTLAQAAAVARPRPPAAAPPTAGDPAAPKAAAQPVAAGAQAATAPARPPASASGPTPTGLTPQQVALLRHAADAPAAGTCDERSCLKKGWTLRVGAAELRVRCAPGGCPVAGWTATLPGGEQSRTLCLRSDCFKEGWTTTLPDRTRTESICNFNECWKDGWTTTFPGHARSPTSCDRGDCGSNGWSTLLPGGRSVRCRCLGRSCADNGAECN